MRRGKKFLALLLIITFLLTQLPVTLLAEAGEDLSSITVSQRQGEMENGVSEDDQPGINDNTINPDDGD